MKNIFKNMSLLIVFAIVGSAFYQADVRADEGYYDDEGVYHEYEGRHHHGIVGGVLSLPGRTVDAAVGVDYYDNCEDRWTAGSRERCRERRDERRRRDENERRYETKPVVQPVQRVNPQPAYANQQQGMATE